MAEKYSFARGLMNYAVPAFTYRTGSNVMEIDITLVSKVGPFMFGEYGFFYNGQLFGIAVLSQPQEKTNDTFDRIGNTINLRFPLLFQDAGSTVDLNVIAQIFHSLNVADTDAQLPSLDVNSPNAYIVKNHGETDNTALAYKDYDDNIWRFVSVPIFSGQTNRILASNAEGVISPTAVARNKMTVLDGNFNINLNK
jgi:hypothetical protein